MRFGRKRKRRDRGDLPLEDVASRITAYVYGNIIVLATLIPLSREDAQSGWSFWIVLGASATTFLAHTFAESVGLRVRSDHRLSREEARHELRNSMPVLTSGVFPAAVLGLAALFGAPGEWAQLAAEIYVIVRLGLTGVIVARIRKQPSSLRMILSGVGVAVVAAGIAVAKILIGH